MASNHPKYYFPDGHVIIQGVERQYRIHRYLLGQTALRRLRYIRRGESVDGLHGVDIVQVKWTSDDQLDAFLDVLYHPDDLEAGPLSQNTLILALQVSERLRMRDLSTSITNKIRAIDSKKDFPWALDVLWCCFQYPAYFPREYVQKQYGSVCANKQRIEPVHLKGFNKKMLASIMAGREMARKTINNTSADHLLSRLEWYDFLDRMFPYAFNIPGWTIGPKSISWTLSRDAFFWFIVAMHALLFPIWILVFIPFYVAKNPAVLRKPDFWASLQLTVIAFAGYVYLLYALWSSYH